MASAPCAATHINLNLQRYCFSAPHTRITQFLDYDINRDIIFRHEHACSVCVCVCVCGCGCVHVCMCACVYGFFVSSWAEGEDVI